MLRDSFLSCHRSITEFFSKLLGSFKTSSGRPPDFLSGQVEPGLAVSKGRRTRTPKTLGRQRISFCWRLALGVGLA